MARYTNLPGELKQEIASHLDLDSMAALKKAGKNTLVPTVTQCCLKPSLKEIYTVMTAKLQERQIDTRPVLFADRNGDPETMMIDSRSRKWTNHGVIARKEVSGDQLFEYLSDKVLLPLKPHLYIDILKSRKSCLENRVYLKMCFHNWMIDSFEQTNTAYTMVIQLKKFYQFLESILPINYKVMDYYLTITSKHTEPYAILLDQEQKEVIDATLALLRVIDPQDYII